MACLYCFTFPWLSWLPHCLKRGDLRRKYGLREEPCGDCPTTFCCSACALCQEARFLKRRGKLKYKQKTYLLIVLTLYSCSWTRNYYCKCCCARSCTTYTSTTSKLLTIATIHVINFHDNSYCVTF